MNRTPFTLILSAILALSLGSGCGRRNQSLTLRLFVDGSDTIKVNGNRLWIEHQTFQLPGKTIYVNDRAWTPEWNDKVSAAFEELAPAFRPARGANVQLVKHSGRGLAAITEMPGAGNGGTLAIAIDDDSFTGADWYELVVTW